MPLSGRLLADFSDFTDAVKRAEVELRGMETSAGKVGTSLNRMVDNFSGRKLIQDATLAAEAIELIGGTSRLTEAELDRVTRQATEAAAKLKAMGHEVPPGIAAIAAQAKSAGVEIGGLSGITGNVKNVLGSLAGAFGVAFSVGAVVNFGKKVFDAAGEIQDLSQKLGISTDAVQGFKFAAEQSGATLDTVGSAINKLNLNLAGGDKSTVNALKDLGLRFQDIRALKPEDAFLAVTDSIGKIEDPMRRAEAAVSVFGKTGAELLPAIQEGFRSTANAADKMSADTIRRLDEAGDAWARLGNTAVVWSGEVIAAVSRDIDRAKSSWEGFFKTALKWSTAALPGGNFIKFDFDTKRVGDVKLPPLTPPPPVIDPKHTKEMEQYANTLQAIIDKMTGADLAGEVKRLADAYNSPNWTNTPQAFAAFAKAAEDLRQKGAKLTPQLMAIAVEAGALTDGLQKSAMSLSDLGRIGETVNVRQATQSFTDLLGVMGKVPEGTYGIMTGLDKLGKVQELPKKVKDVTIEFGDLSRALSQLAQVSGGSFGAVSQGLSSIVGSLDTAQKGIAAFKTGLSAAKSGEALSGIAGMASGIGGIVTAAVAAAKAVGAIWNALDGDKGRDKVEDFAKSFGGFDSLHKELETLGAAGEQLWIKLTQGVGRNNPAQAERVIAEVEEALARQKKAQDDAIISTEEGARATIETATEAQKALDELSGRLVVNADEWGKWSAEVEAHIQRLAAGIRSLPPLPPNYTGGAVLNQPGAILTGRGPAGAYAPVSGAGGGPAVIHQTIEMNGRNLWEGLLEVGAAEGIF